MSQLVLSTALDYSPVIKQQKKKKTTKKNHDTKLRRVTRRLCCYSGDLDRLERKLMRFDKGKM